MYVSVCVCVCVHMRVCVCVYMYMCMCTLYLTYMVELSGECYNVGCQSKLVFLGPVTVTEFLQRMLHNKMKLNRAGLVHHSGLRGSPPF